MTRSPREASLGGVGEIIGFAVAALVLLITFGSLVAAGLPLLTALIGVVIGIMGITAATGFVDMDSAVPTVALMLGLAVGIDYALFIISRHRAQLFEGMDPEESAARAVGTAGSAVVFAGATVVIALASLAVVGIPFMTAMGLAAAGTVAVAVRGLAHARSRAARVRRHCGWRRARTSRPARARPSRRSARAGSACSRVTACPPWCCRCSRWARCRSPCWTCASASPTTRPPRRRRPTARPTTCSSTAFGPGFNGPLTIVVDARRGREREGRGRRRRVGVRAARGRRRRRHAGRSTDAGDTAIVSLTPRSGPSTEATKDLVKQIRDRTDTLDGELGATVLVTGPDRRQHRLRRAAVRRADPVPGPDRRPRVPAADDRVPVDPRPAHGRRRVPADDRRRVRRARRGLPAGHVRRACSAIEQTAPIVSVLPIFIVGILFGLAMDYQVFLVSRMREEHVHGAGPTRAITEGFRHGARVVTGAALIMGGVFAGFIVEDSALIKSIGFALAFGILIDAFVVRMTLIPARDGAARRARVVAAALARPAAPARGRRGASSSGGVSPKRSLLPREPPVRISFSMARSPAKGFNGPLVRHGLSIVVAGMLLVLASCGSEPAPVAKRAQPPTADERRLVNEFNALLRGVAIDARLLATECITLPRRTRAELRDSPQRIASARARLARLRVPDTYDRVRTRLDEGLRLIAEANKLLLAWSERSDNPATGGCGPSGDNLRDNAYDEFHDLAKPHLQAFMDKHNAIAARMRATGWRLGAAGLIPRRR